MMGEPEVEKREMKKGWSIVQNRYTYLVLCENFGLGAIHSIFFPLMPSTHQGAKTNQYTTCMLCRMKILFKPSSDSICTDFGN